jgi:hypothetical protein
MREPMGTQTDATKKRRDPPLGLQEATNDLGSVETLLDIEITGRLVEHVAV